ncbi:hypothetical protein BDR03DRAFT_1093675 [Suillus americanus]|nr:hypothetical protein BDR03DRAFT_1093675 [Suillus americanus]
MDPAQNLIAITYAITADHLRWGNKRFYVDFGTLDGGGIHPRAAGQTLFLLDLRLPGCENGLIEIDDCELKGLDRHIAFWRSLLISNATSRVWELQIWDWKQSTTSSSVLTGPLEHGEIADFYFLAHDRLLVFSHNLDSIEDMSQAPQLLACFMMVVPVMRIFYAECTCPVDDSTQPLMQAQQMVWTYDRYHRLTGNPRLVKLDDEPTLRRGCIGHKIR